MGMCVIEEISRSSSTLLSELCTTIQEKEAKEVEEVEDEVEGVVVGPLPNLLYQCTYLLTYLLLSLFFSFLFANAVDGSHSLARVIATVLTTQHSQTRGFCYVPVRRRYYILLPGERANCSIMHCNVPRPPTSHHHRNELQQPYLALEPGATCVQRLQRSTEGTLAGRPFISSYVLKKKYNISECSPQLNC